LWQPDL